MKLASFNNGGKAHVGIVDSEALRIFDLTTAAQRAGNESGAFISMLSLIDAGEGALDDAQSLYEKNRTDDDLTHQLDGLQLLAPLPEPRQMRDAMSFATHIVQSGSGRGRELAKARAERNVQEVKRIEAQPPAPLPAVYKQIPIYYITNRFSVRGPDSTVQWPRYSEIMDYELEFGVVTKGRATNVTAEKARDHIFGFTIFNDFSARDRQMQEMQGRLGPSKGKSFDGGNVLGPWIVTPDEIGDPYSLAMKARINGQTVVETSTRDMLFSFEEMLAYITQDETVMPGEFLGSGTVGNGCAAENGHFLQHGDTIELEVEKIGVLRNSVERQSS